MAVTRKDILNDLELIKKGLQEIEFYLRNNVTDDNEIIEKGINGVIDYMKKILKEIVNTRAVSYSQILEDAKKRGLEKEFRAAYSLLRQTNFINYDKQNKLIIIGNRTKYLLKLFTDSKSIKSQKEKQEKPEALDQKKIDEIYKWVLDQIDKHNWIDIKIINTEFEGYQKEIIEAINKIIAEGKGKLVDGKYLYKADGEKPVKSIDTSKVKRIKELKDQIETLERKIRVGKSIELSKEELQKLEEEKKKLKEELKKLEK
ncbi:MAG: hypothetical protein ACO2ON_03855 [Candidatus Nanopusillus sp.]